MKRQIITSLKALGIMTLLLGIVYPLLITGIGQLVFPAKANGSLVDVDGALKGSLLIGQKMDSAIYFNPRPSATDYNTLPSGGSNLSLTSKKLKDEVAHRRADIDTKYHLSESTPIPSEMLFASASGLDPHISPQAAKMQMSSIAKARGFSEETKIELDKLIDKLTESPQFGIFGTERINVFMLNLELDKLK